MIFNKRSLIAATLIAAVCSVPQVTFAAEKSKKSFIDAGDSKVLASKTGKEVTVQGSVLGTFKGKDDGIRILEFSDKKGQGFVAAIFPAAYKGVGPIKKYKGKTVRVSGVLEKYKKQTQIKVVRASQVKVVESSGKKR